MTKRFNEREKRMKKGEGEEKKREGREFAGRGRKEDFLLDRYLYLLFFRSNMSVTSSNFDRKRWRVILQRERERENREREREEKRRERTRRNEATNCIILYRT